MKGAKRQKKRIAKINKKKNKVHEVFIFWKSNFVYIISSKKFHILYTFNLIKIFHRWNVIFLPIIVAEKTWFIIIFRRIAAATKHCIYEKKK